jgi:hypothetical protein
MNRVRVLVSALVVAAVLGVASAPTFAAPGQNPGQHCQNGNLVNGKCVTKQNTN